MKPLEVQIPSAQKTHRIEFPESQDDLARELKQYIENRSYVLVTDENVRKFSDLPKIFPSENIFVLPEGEEAKTWKWSEKLLSFCFEKHLDRSSVLISLGGGVVTDVTGFAASLFMRGTNVVHIPTSLLGMVDAAIGGKTAINCEYGKNLIGTIHQPEKVSCCRKFLQSLPESEIKNGLCEMIKHGIIASPQHFEDLEKIANPHPTGDQIFPLIRDSIEIKMKFIEEDEMEKDARLALNLGHTFGHGIELLSEYKISHGQAVAIGCVMAANYAVEHGICDEKTRDRIENIFHAFKINTRCDFAESDIWKAMQHDKKCVNGRIRLILPTKIGAITVVTV